MSFYRIFVEKKPAFRVEAESLRAELNENLQLSLPKLRLLNVYDLFGFTEDLVVKSKYSVFGEVVTDDVTVSEGEAAAGLFREADALAIEYLPGQFDQRAASAEACVKLLDPSADIRIKSAKLVIAEGASADEMARIRHYMINAVECREKDLSRLTDTEQAPVRPVPVLDGFRNLPLPNEAAAGCETVVGYEAAAGCETATGCETAVGYEAATGCPEGAYPLVSANEEHLAAGNSAEAQSGAVEGAANGHLAAGNSAEAQSGAVEGAANGHPAAGNSAEAQSGAVEGAANEHPAAGNSAEAQSGAAGGGQSAAREKLSAFCKQFGLAMNADDLAEVVKYFREEGRDPNETELRILDTYWSDHCRHTTFTTQLQSIDVDESFIKEDIDGTLQMYARIREELGRTHKDICLMDLATVGARYLKAKGLLDDMEVSEENNACSIYVDVDNDGVMEKWLLMFKNETHNHPTEIEPFGGAATCLGGAIRDPLSGRSYVYQAMRVTGAGNVWKPVPETLPGKLPQKVISRKAAAGYSSYGNQIGLATTHVREIIHPGYIAKRLEIGAVVGAVKAENVRRERPVPGDVILLLGGRTGRDGIGGATGSSKEHTEASLETCGSEVQKGNPPEERKLQRLFRRPEVTRLIKKSNDFGAGGVSVAIGELADGLDIWLDRVPTKYSGLNATELAISESQERMAVVIEAKDEAAFRAFCRQENIETTHVAEVTDTAHMRMFYHDACVADLARSFIDSAGAKHYSRAVVGAVEDKEPFLPREEFEGKSLKEKLFSLMADPQVCSQKGLVEMFDSTIGRSTVLMPYGGMLQTTETQVSVQKLPTDGYTDTASMMAFGYNPWLASWSPYHGAAYAVVEACAKVVAAGGDWKGMRFSYQEYFERMTADPRTWGKPLAALLGALKMQVAFGLPSIGGKDSMSGTFEDIHVPPTLVAFGITTVNAGTVISPELKWEGNNLYLIRHTPLDNRMPDVDQLKANWDFVHREIEAGNIVSAYATGPNGAAEALCKMAFGNAFGVEVKASEDDLFGGAPGCIVVEAENPLDYPNTVLLGHVTSGEDGLLHINGTPVDLFELMNANLSGWARVYPDRSKADFKRILPKGMEGVKPFKASKADLKYPGEKVEKPVVYIPVFPGTNCDYDTAKAFRKEGAEVRFGVFCNLTQEDIFRSIDEMAEALKQCHILALAGGFSAGDEPDGSGKFIANVLNNPRIAEQVHALLDRGGLILGICNGFQALVKSGLLPYGRLGQVTEASPTLFRNDINRHISQMVTTRVSTTHSPWLAGLTVGQEFAIPVSHGEGKFVVSEELAKELFQNGQVAFQYVDPVTDEITMGSPENPNGSYYAIEGIISRDGRILGKMGHSERYEKNLFKNIDDDLEQPLFRNAVNYFRGKN